MKLTIENMDLQNLRTANINRDKQWNPNGNITLSFRGVELAGEAGEACNVIKKIERVKLGLRGGGGSAKQALAEELADVIICTDLIAMDLGIDLSRAIKDKFNASSEKMGLDERL